MTIHKLKKHQDDIPYTMLSREVTQQITNPSSLAIWTYLQSLPPDWDISESHIRKHFGMGRTRYMDAMRALRENGLYEVIHIKNEKSQFVGSYYHIYSTPQVRKPELPETRLTENHTELTEKTLLHRTIKDKEEDTFDHFWALWPKKVAKIDALKAWKSLTTAHQQKAFHDAPTRYSDTDPHFIPNPATYLRGQRWNDARIEKPAETIDLILNNIRESNYEQTGSTGNNGQAFLGNGSAMGQNSISQAGSLCASAQDMGEDFDPFGF